MHFQAEKLSIPDKPDTKHDARPPQNTKKLKSKDDLSKNCKKAK